eukprot:56243_1
MSAVVDFWNYIHRCLVMNKLVNIGNTLVNMLKRKLCDNYIDGTLDNFWIFELILLACNGNTKINVIGSSQKKSKKWLQRNEDACEIGLKLHSSLHELFIHGSNNKYLA